MVQILAVGEVMVELAPAGLAAQDNLMRLGFAGDTYNSAVYAARLGLAVGYFTRLGDDPYSAQAIARMNAEGLETSSVETVAGRTPGLYMIANQANGERTFTFWRSQSPARELFATPASIQALQEQLHTTEYVYFSGISLGIISEPARQQFFTLLKNFRSQGGKVIFDNNYRQQLWPEPAKAQQAMQLALECTDIALLTDDDYARLWGDARFEQVLTRCKQAGVTEVVLKCGPKPVCIALLNQQGAYETAEIAVPPVANVIDTTAAGDSFNAGYLFSRLTNNGPVVAAQFGSRCASIVIAHRGAIVDRAVFLAAIAS